MGYSARQSHKSPKRTRRQEAGPTFPRTPPRMGTAGSEGETQIMSTYRRAAGAASLAALSLIVSACGGGNDPAAGTVKTSEVADDTAAKGAAGARTGAVSDLEGVEQATVQIVAEGAFVDPEFGQYESSGAGTGFIIDPSGIAVTNNHVVTGSALLQVYVPGEDEPKNAKILGVSECSDLAVIDIDGEGFPFLDWYSSDIKPGLEVYSAGYPLGDPEYTLTKGIVSKADYDIETPWASVDSIIEHDARIRGGNSGGPLVTADGKVVGVNYAGSDQTDQNLAINNAEAQPIIEQLRAGTDVTSIGVNGFAVDDGQGITGVWVSSVASGSPADEAGITGGDIITRLENVTLAEDGTLSRYCDIIRSRDAGDPMRIEILRYATEQVLEGQINGDELIESFSFAQELDEGTAAVGGYSGYTMIQDDSGSISLEVPSEWADVDGAPYTDDGGNEIFDVRAASDLETFMNSWDTPGVIVSASVDLAQNNNEVTLLDDLVDALSGQCTYVGRSDYEDALYTGAYDVYEDCGGTGATYVVVGAVPEDRSFVVRVQIQANSDADFEALDHILDTFVVG